jgi:hypothetical protein
MVEEDMMDLLILAMMHFTVNYTKNECSNKSEFISSELRHIEVFQKGDEQYVTESKVIFPYMEKSVNEDRRKLILNLSKNGVKLNSPLKKNHKGKENIVDFFFFLVVKNYCLQI